MRTCRKCQNDIPNSVIIDGKKRVLSSRLFCLECRPFNCKNSSKFADGARPAAIDNLSVEQFSNLINTSQSRSEVFDKLQMRKSGESFKILNRRIKKENIDISHFKTGGYFSRKSRITNEEIFIKGNRDITAKVRSRLIRDKIIPYKCKKCNIEDKWLNEPIILELDHIDGNRYNNELNNLRFLCPNCHSQTETFCGKKKKIKPVRVCNCGNIINKHYKKQICSKCNKDIIENSKKPTKEQLYVDIYNLDSNGLKNKYNVRINKIKKWCVEYDIIFPHKNYWRLRRLGKSHDEALNYKKKTRKPLNLLKKEQVIQIKNLINEGRMSLREIGKQFNRKHQIIIDIRDNKIKRYNNFLMETQHESRAGLLQSQG
jgi:DNA-directed RNA polymerase subunit N (RpoN/RPB10)